MSLLTDILAQKERELPMLAASMPTSPPPAPRNVETALRRAPGAPLRLICEHKRKSPSAGALSTRLSVEERCLSYAAGGAAMLSVLCDGVYFDGAFDHLRRARQALDAAGFQTPLLAKEFIIDGVQLAHARANGADAALLIARVLPGARLSHLVDECLALELTPVVEVVTSAELAAALATRARVVGVNARDLDTLQMDLARAREVLADIPQERIACHFSGIGKADDVAAIANGRADCALVGEALMRQADPAPLLAALRAATTPARPTPRS